MGNTQLGRLNQKPMTNKSGGVHVQGDVCVTSTSDAASVVNTTTSGYVAGKIWVCLDLSVAVNAVGMYACDGAIPKINLASSASLGDLVKCHTVAKQGTPHAAPMVSGDFAQVLGTGTSPAAILFGLPFSGSSGAGTDTTAIHDDTASEISAIAEKTTLADNDLFLIEDSAAGNAKKRVKKSNVAAGASPSRSYFTYLATMLEPDAISLQTGSFTLALSAGTPKIVLASYNTRLGSAGRFEARNPTRPAILNYAGNFVGLGSDACAVILDPAAATYADAEATYYARLAAIPTLTMQQIDLSAAQTKMFLPGAYGALILHLTSYDYDWIIAHPFTAVAWNLWDEIGDSTVQRLGDWLAIPVSKISVASLQSTGAGGLGTVLYAHLPSTWSKVTDATSYNFRDDFAGASLDTVTKWTRAQSSAGYVEIDTQFQWLRTRGDGNWGNNGCYSQTGITKSNGKVFQCDFYIDTTTAGTAPATVVGFSDGGGQSYTNFAYGLIMSMSAGNIVLGVYENGNSRGTVGTGATVRSVYRLRITCQGGGTAAAKYEIQGGSQYATIGGATWTDITPGTTSSATTTLYAGVTANANTTDYVWVGDVKVY